MNGHAHFTGVSDDYGSPERVANIRLTLATMKAQQDAGTPLTDAQYHLIGKLHYELTYARLFGGEA